MRPAFAVLMASLLAARPAAGFSLRVVAASELRLEPRVAPDRSSLAVAVHLLNDHTEAVRHATLRLHARVRETGRVEDRQLVTDDHGEATWEVALSPSDRQLDLDAEFGGDGSTAATARTTTINLDAPFVTPELRPVPFPVETGGPEVTLVVVVHVGEVVQWNAGNRAVEVAELGHPEQLFAEGMTDETGRAEFHVPVGRFGGAGVRTLVPRVSVGADTVQGSARQVIVIAPTALTLARADTNGSTESAVLRGVLVTPDGPVRDAPVRLVRGDRTLAGARTGTDGAFEFRAGADLLLQNDVVVRAVFDPTEPWFHAAESLPLQLTPPPPPRVPWPWEIVPVLAAGVVLGVVLARGRARGPVAPTRVSSGEDTAVEHVQAGPAGGFRVRFVVTDRATGRPLERPCVRWTRDGEWATVGPDVVDVPPARRAEFEVGASGYAPRTVKADFPRPGLYVVRVPLRTWREELFDRARPWLRRATRGGAVLPTPREAFARGEAVRDAPGGFVELIEVGCYGPAAPGTREIDAADALLASSDGHVPQTER